MSKYVVHSKTKPLTKEGAQRKAAALKKVDGYEKVSVRVVKPKAAAVTKKPAKKVAKSKKR